MKVFLGISQWLLLGFFVHKVLEINFNFSCQKVRNQKKNKGTEYSTFKTKEKRLYFFWFFTCWYSELKCVSKNPAIYNILRWVAWTMGQKNRRPRVWCSIYVFFNTFYRLRALKTLYFYFCNLKKKNKKIDWKDFCKEFCKKSWKKNITWNMRCLVDDLFVPSSKQPSITYCRLSDFKSSLSDNIYCAHWEHR